MVQLAVAWTGSSLVMLVTDVRRHAWKSLPLAFKSRRDFGACRRWFGGFSGRRRRSSDGVIGRGLDLGPTW